jgi:hypothetical protein
MMWEPGAGRACERVCPASYSTDYRVKSIEVTLIFLVILKLFKQESTVTDDFAFIGGSITGVAQVD